MAHIVTKTGIGKPIPSGSVFLDVAGDVNFDANLQVVGVSTFSDYLSIQKATNDVSLETRVPGEAEPLFTIKRDGLLSWGVGATSSLDVFLERSNSAELTLTGSLIISQDFSVLVDASIQGDLTVNGHTTFGQNSSDNMTVNATITSHLVPSATATYDLGSISNRWRDLYIADNATFGTSSSDVVTVNSSIENSLVPLNNNSYDLGTAANRWRNLYLSNDLQVQGNTLLGDSLATDTVTFNSKIATDFIPANSNLDLGATSAPWHTINVGNLLENQGDATMGSSSANFITFNARINSDFIPQTDVTYGLGSSSLRWSQLFVGSIDSNGSLTVGGDTTLGSSSSNTVTFNARVNSHIIPDADNTYDLGSSALRWQTVHVGPGSFVVHNDATDTLKATFGFLSTDAALFTDAATALLLKTGSNNGVYLDTSGNLGVNKVSGLVYSLDVEGDAGFTDTINANKASGISLFVESDVAVKGSIEAASVTNSLDIGTTAVTEYINIGTGTSLQTINLGTGSGPTVINIGSSNDTVNISGTVNNVTTNDTAVVDKSLTLNAGGANGTTPFSGVFIEQADSTLLTVTDAVWQSNDIVRYSMANTGNLNIGKLVTFSGFTNTENNGTFTVTSFSANSYVEVSNPNRPDATLDETGVSASATNPTLPASLQLSSAADAWELYSTINSTNLFSFKNTGGNTTFTSSSSALIISAPGSVIKPATANDQFGESALRWDIFGGATDLTTLDVSGAANLLGSVNLGDANTDFITFTGTPFFNSNIGSNLLPNNNASLDLGSASLKWRNLFISDSADVDGSLDVAVNTDVGGDLTVVGNTTLGDTLSTDSVTFNSQIASSIIPGSDAAHDLGSSTKRWSGIFTDSLNITSFTAGSILFAGASGAISQNNSQFFWDNSAHRLGIGQSVPQVKLHLSDSTAGSGFRLERTDTPAGIGLFGDVTSRIQYTDSLVFSYDSVANLGSSSAGSPAMELTGTGQLNLFSGFSYQSNAVVNTNTYTVSSTDALIRVDTTDVGITANCTISLPDASSRRMLIVKDIGNSASTTNKNILLAPSAGQSVEFNATDEAYVMDIDGMALTLHSDGVDTWYII